MIGVMLVVKNLVRRKIRTLLTDEDGDVRATALNALVTLDVPDAETLALDAKRDEIGDGDQNESMFGCKLDQIRKPGRLSIVGNDLRQGCGGIGSRQPGQIQ